MIESEEHSRSETIKEIWQPSTWMFYVAAVTACIFGVWAISGSVAASNASKAASNANAASEKRLAELRASSEAKIQDARRKGLKRTASAVASSLEPVMLLKDQVPEITDRTLQTSVRGMVQDESFRFVAIADGSGKVVAASDLTLVGRPLATPRGMLLESASIGEASERGTVVLGVRQTL